MWVALVGTALCIAVMFLMDWVTALITFAIVGILYFYISYRKPDANWGSSTQAQQFVSALRSVQTLNDIPEHVKNYRWELEPSHFRRFKKMDFFVFFQAQDYRVVWNSSPQAALGRLCKLVYKEALSVNLRSC